MARCKTLRSAIHNHAHSALSFMSYTGGDYFIEQVTRSARAADAPEVEIDWLTGRVSPEAVATAPIRLSIAQHRSWLPKHFASMDTSLDLLRSLVMRLTFDFSAVPPQPTLRCTMEAEDDRGREYAIPVEPVQPLGTV
jgi:hypothetical protein